MNAVVSVHDQSSSSPRPVVRNKKTIVDADPATLPLHIDKNDLQEQLAPPRRCLFVHAVCALGSHSRCSHSNSRPFHVAGSAQYFQLHVSRFLVNASQFQ